ncbi:MAG: hypothetical protein A2381_13220 [Bdellovibrionales bacterium RIFOXYB1_FULL_37_110]|nr:MAG: hypothetical protein A2181_02545 [Bdellovibrionales bacterium RIFOXYA1_FULL_38_20]OFZ51663.1 MAG: hypothetical protein A2417_12880 [Bdellovibrionales bacterium RIFOXYC1_FULL_37_79]OFZ60490.1 MAG: hypothetical protein A2381_13220 [Bdellovibrionales bacterium RIFOXYB1_FULL_37_110]OFZ65064.1 MAG: hypothetical protein A2577_09485 [Bdellovibrionales bacterium RIFOXYD1_FULL_36_51]
MSLLRYLLEIIHEDGYCPTSVFWFKKIEDVVKNLVKLGPLLLFVILLISCARTELQTGFKNDSSKIDYPYVLIISFDGFRYDYIDRFNPPNLTAFYQTGVKAKSLRPVYPSSTFPNHYSIITGLYAGNHGIIANNFYDEKMNRYYKLSDRSAISDPSYYSGEPLWNTVQKNGMASATYYWPGSEADINGLYPTYWFKYEHTTPHEVRIKQVVDWFKLPKETRPHLVTLYFPDTDDYGHSHGTDSQEIKAAVMKLDQSFGKLMGEIEKLPFKINVIVLSDHGMQNQDFKKVEYLDDCVDVKDINVIGSGPYANLYIKDKSRVEAVALKLNTCNKKFKAYRREKIPANFQLNNHPHVGDVHVTTKVPYIISIKGKNNFSIGNHGYDPYENQSMHGIFMAKGPDIGEGMMIDTVDNIHVYPFVLAILKTPYQHQIDGQENVLKKILRK